MARYGFLTTWILEAPIERVWDVLYDAARWPEWWRGVIRTEVLDGGSLWRTTWRSRLPYELDFEFEILETARPHFLLGRARGELAGEGRWRLFEHEGLTASTWDWEVETTAAWMNALRPVAKPVFAWNHHWVMRRGAEGLARELGARLVAAT